MINRDWFQRYQEARIPIKIANGKHVYAEGYGSVKIPYTTADGKKIYLLLQRALHVPTCPTNLLSVAQVTDAGHSISLAGGDNGTSAITVKDGGGKIDLTRTKRLWTFKPTPLSGAVAAQ